MSSATTPTSEPPAAGNAFLKAVENRRTIYHITNSIPIPHQRLLDILHFALKHTPSPFSSQSSRILLLLGTEHAWLRETVLTVLKPVAPAEFYPRAESKVNNSFRPGYGTVLFFEDEADVRDMQERWPTYRDYFPQWSQHTSGMMQFVVWTALASEGMAASLQHFNPLIDEKVRERFGLPSTWTLVAQMPFGQAAGPAEKKTFKPIESRFKVFGE